MIPHCDESWQRLTGSLGHILLVSVQLARQHWGQILPEKGQKQWGKLEDYSSCTWIPRKVLKGSAVTMSFARPTWLSSTSRLWFSEDWCTSCGDFKLGKAILDNKEATDNWLTKEKKAEKREREKWGHERRKRVAHSEKQPKRFECKRRKELDWVKNDRRSSTQRFSLGKIHTSRRCYQNSMNHLGFMPWFWVFISVITFLDFSTYQREFAGKKSTTLGGHSSEYTAERGVGENRGHTREYTANSTTLAHLFLACLQNSDAPN